jgi:hypothetical protein
LVGPSRLLDLPYVAGVLFLNFFLQTIQVFLPARGTYTAQTHHDLRRMVIIISQIHPTQKDQTLGFHLCAGSIGWIGPCIVLILAFSAGMTYKFR